MQVSEYILIIHFFYWMPYFCTLTIVPLPSEAGDQLLPDQHEVMDFFDGEIEGVIINELRPGLLDKDGQIVRCVVLKERSHISVFRYARGTFTSFCSLYLS